MRKDSSPGVKPSCELAMDPSVFGVAATPTVFAGVTPTAACTSAPATSAVGKSIAEGCGAATDRVAVVPSVGTISPFGP